MWYLFEVYNDDHNSMKNTLKEIECRLIDLMDKLDKFLADELDTDLSDLCHKSSNEAFLLGAVTLKLQLLTIENLVLSNEVSHLDLCNEVRQTVTLVKETLKNLRLFLNYYEGEH